MLFRVEDNKTGTFTLNTLRDQHEESYTVAAEPIVSSSGGLRTMQRPLNAPKRLLNWITIPGLRPSIYTLKVP